MTRIGDIGTANIVLSNEKKAFYVSLALIKPKKINSYFLKESIHSPFVKKDLWHRTLHIAFPKKINKNEIDKLLISYPNENEQKRIGGFFSYIDKLITLHQRKCEKLQNIKKSLLEKMFPKNNEKFPEIRFKGFTNAWELRILGDITTEIKRIDSDSIAPVMMISAANGFINQSEKYSSDNAGQSLSKYILLQKGELAYNHGASKQRKYGSCFALTINEARIPFVYHCFKINENNPYFIAIELNEPRIDLQLRRLVSSGARMDGLLNISYESYMTVLVKTTKKDEQDKIVKFLNYIDKSITLHQRQIEKLQHIKKSLLEKMFI